MKFLILLALVAAVAADVSHLFGNQHHHHHAAPVVKSFDSFPAQSQYQKPIAILRLVQDNSGLGDYRYAFETENGIQVQEEGVLKNAGSKDEAKSAQGSYSYVGDDGQTYTVNWVADENGYRASGAHLPVAPEIPEAIKKSLEFIASQPQQQDQF
ncbi:Cuticle Protein CPR RR-1 9 [Frankliniella occidentalis]|uniref:Endocuticle structural glycoprotein ABD-5-like n=1 Tax=Frankliniella occidentalis TaxID=133901 RepID=A0A6J1RYB6_FRAOC|nr:endocuticle structural glycoprotein ABD-5-like [Frankliniella occidentalis]KAE8741348.1 Cuticle Protein CPR RR-1 9 [Frankliniella occidentalis]